MIRALLSSLVLCAAVRAQVSVVNNASFRGDQPVTAGSWVAAFAAFTGVAATTAQSFPLPKTLGGVTVKIDGVDAAVYDVRASQVTFIMPYAVQPGVRPVQITTGSGTVSGSVRVMSTGPGLFTKDSQSPPKGAILNQDSRENTSSNLARRGEVIQIYATGPGALNATVQDGVAPPPAPLITTQSTPQVYIGGVQAEVQFSGLAPGLPGVWQINAFVPNLAFITGRVAVRVFMDGVDSNEVAVFVE
jgi:minor extracellular serine protease Vpr